MDRKAFHGTGTPQPASRAEQVDQVRHDLFQGTVLGTVSVHPISAIERARGIASKTLRSVLQDQEEIDLTNFYREESLVARLQRLIDDDTDGRVKEYFRGFSDRLPSIIHATLDPLVIERYLFAADILRQVGLPVAMDSAEAFDIRKLTVSE